MNDTLQDYPDLW